MDEQPMEYPQSETRTRKASEALSEDQAMNRPTKAARYSSEIKAQQPSAQEVNQRADSHRLDRFQFFSLDESRPLCACCSSLRYPNATVAPDFQHRVQISLEDHDTKCPLCRLFHEVLTRKAQSYSGWPDLIELSSKDEVFHLTFDYNRFFGSQLTPTNEQQLRGITISCESRNASSDVVQGTWPLEYQSSDSLFVEYSRLSDSVNQLFVDYTLWPIPSEDHPTTAKFVPKSTWCDPLSPHCLHTAVVQDTTDLEAIHLIQRWIDRCESTHEHCRAKSWPPTRLIDVGEKVSSNIRLCATNGHELRWKDVQYIALSYCWGQNAAATPFATMSSNIDRYMTKIEQNDLPKTIRDAIVLTRRLGRRYLWVDSLCIIQGRDAVAAEDWLKESSTMANVYGNAWLTIAAAWGSSMRDGIFNMRYVDSSNSLELGVRSVEDPDRKGRLMLEKAGQRPVECMDEPLYSRAWALQERILSRRILICTRDQFIWECQETSFTESGFEQQSIAAMRLDQEFRRDLAKDHFALRNTWQCIVTDYSHKGLTDPFDKLPAIGCLAVRFQQLAPTNAYLAGLWQDSIMDDLLWAHMNLGRYRRQHDSGVPNSRYIPRFKLTKYRAPSWSWASVEGGIRWLHADRNGKGKYHAKMIEHAIQPRHSNSFGQIQGGYIVLEAPIWKLPDSYKSVLLDTIGNRHDHLNDDELAPQLRNWQQATSMDLHADDEQCHQSLRNVLGEDEVQRTDLFLMNIRDWECLILSSPQSYGSEQQRCYQRVGLYSGTQRKIKDHGNFEIAVCKIV